jgi:hypothetical protein
MEHIKGFNEFLNESEETSDIIKDLDRVKNDLIKRVDVLIAKKKMTFSAVSAKTQNDLLKIEDLF